MSGDYQHDPSYEQDENRLDQDFSVDSDEEADEAAFGEEWKEFRRAFPSDNNEGSKFETENDSNTWAMRQPQNPFDEEDEIADEEDPFATQASDPFGSGDADDFGGFVSAGNENETGNKKAAEDPFGQFEQEAEKEVSWSNFASDFGEFEKLKVTNVESPNVEFLTPTTESEFHIEDTGETHDQAEPSTRSSEGQESAQ